MKRKIKLLLLLLLLIFTTSCYTILNGGKEVVFVKSTPAGANVYLNEKYCGKTPLTTMVSKRKNVDVSLSLEGYNNFKYNFATKIQAGRPIATTIGTFAGLLLTIFTADKNIRSNPFLTMLNVIVSVYGTFIISPIIMTVEYFTGSYNELLNNDITVHLNPSIVPFSNDTVYNLKFENINSKIPNIPVGKYYEYGIPTKNDVIMNSNIYLNKENINTLINNELKKFFTESKNDTNYTINSTLINVICDIHINPNIKSNTFSNFIDEITSVSPYKFYEARCTTDVIWQLKDYHDKIVRNDTVRGISLVNEKEGSNAITQSVLSSFYHWMSDYKIVGLLSKRLK